MLNIYEMKYDDFNKLSKNELDNYGMYLLDNGMIFMLGRLYGSDTQLVDFFPTTPIPNVVYIHKNTLEQKVWIENLGWQTVQELPEEITNNEIESLLNL